ncbi:MAG: hypothetical protein IPJ85_06945 [Flavobacteriales bacterium]|nr:hypothetical protein [Flavobacteriales bacterium]
MQQVLLFILVVLPCVLSAQTAPPIHWQRTYGGPGYDVGYIARQTADGGYVLVGSAGEQGVDVDENQGQPDIWVVRTNAAGVPQWNTTIGGAGDDQGAAIAETADGGFIAVGFANSNNGMLTEGHGDYDAVVAKLDANGGVTWVRQFGGSASDGALGMALTVDGGCIVSGLVEFQRWRYQHPPLGATMYGCCAWMRTGICFWELSYGGSDNDWAYTIEKGAGDNYFVAATTHSNNGHITDFQGVADVWVLNVLGDGTLLWQRSIGGTYDDQGNHARPTSDGGCIVTGYYRVYDASIDYAPTYALAAKLNPTGQIDWVRTHGGTAGETGSDIIETASGGYLLLGNSYGNDGVVVGHQGGVDAWLLGLDAAGYLIWQRSYGGASDEYGQYIQTTADGGVLLSCTASSSNGDVTNLIGEHDAWLIKLGAVLSGIDDRDVNALRVIPDGTGYGFDLYTGVPLNMATIDVLDATGRRVSSQPLSGTQAHVDLHECSVGFYVLHVSTATGQRAVHVVRE